MHLSLLEFMRGKRGFKGAEVFNWHSLTNLATISLVLSLAGVTFFKVLKLKIIAVKSKSVTERIATIFLFKNPPYSLNIVPRSEFITLNLYLTSLNGKKYIERNTINVNLNNLTPNEVALLAPLLVACDGSSLGNPGPGGFGWFHSRELFGWGGAEHTTNNAMELAAVLSALDYLPDHADITLVCDSKYVIDSCTKYIYAWKKNGFLTSAGKPVSNKEAIVNISDLLTSRKGKTSWLWVKGHAGHPLNEEADKIAFAAANKFKEGLKQNL